METRSIYPLDLELRRRGGFAEFIGLFRYNSRATVRDRGKVRKEMFAPGAFRFALDDLERDIHLLAGHSYAQPLASRKAGSLELEDTADALRFRAALPDEADRPTWLDDTVKATAAGLVAGVSPGFRVPPKSVVPDAETLEPEEGNPGVSIRVIRQAVLYELSLVTRPAYGETEIDVRADNETDADVSNRRLWLCL